jgi:hypothetical protein
VTLRTPVVLILFIVFFSASSAGAERVVFCDSVPLQDVDWYENFTLPKFNPNLGELKAVDIELKVNLTQRLQMENTGRGNFSINSTTESVLALLLPDGEEINANASLAVLKNLGPYDGAVDFSGSSGIDFSEPSSSGIVMYSCQDISGFLAGGPGENMVLKGVMKSLQNSSVLGSGSSVIQTKADANVCVIYEYDTGAS